MSVMKARTGAGLSNTGARDWGGRAGRHVLQYWTGVTICNNLVWHCHAGLLRSVFLDLPVQRGPADAQAAAGLAHIPPALLQRPEDGLLFHLGQGGSHVG